MAGKLQDGIKEINIKDHVERILIVTLECNKHNYMWYSMYMMYVYMHSHKDRTFSLGLNGH